MKAAPTQDRLAWWREGRFGLFIHWGLYSVAAGHWKGRALPGIGEWLMAQFKVPLAEYKTLASQYRLEHFDADHIVSLAAEAGMKYIVVGAKHHEGFAMWDSQVSDYTIVKATPYARDPMKEFQKACVRHGVHHLALDYSKPPSDAMMPWVWELELDETPTVEQHSIQQPDGHVTLPAHLAQVHISAESAAQQVEVDGNQIFAAIAGEEANLTKGNHLHIGAGGLLEKWNRTSDWVDWTFQITTPGTYAVHVHSVAAKYHDWVGGHTVRVMLNGKPMERHLTPDRKIDAARAHLFEQYATRIGNIDITDPGEHRLELHAIALNPKDPASLSISEIRLEPAP